MGVEGIIGGGWRWGLWGVGGEGPLGGVVNGAWVFGGRWGWDV